MSWRTVGSIDTFVLGLFFSGSAKLSGAIAGTEIVTRILLFYFHERAWLLVRWAIAPNRMQRSTRAMPT